MNRLRELRKKRRLTQYELAKQIGSHQSMIWRWEHGYEEPSEEIKERIGVVLGLPAKEIFPEEAF